MVLSSCKQERDYYEIHQKLKSQFVQAKKALEENLQNQFEWPNNSELIGTRFPPFEVRDLQNSVVTEKTFKGKYQLINMWFINCRPCILEIPRLIDIKQTYPNLEIISFCRDNKESLEAFIKTTPLPFWNIPQSQELLESVFPIYSGYPCNVLLDKNGKICLLAGSLNEKKDFDELVRILEQ